MIVVSDTSCISNLLTVQHAHLLHLLFGEVIIPPAVEIELQRFHPDLPAFLKQASPQNTPLLSKLALELGAGEAEAICLACELKADRLLIDEKHGRKVALREGLAIIGIVGVLVTAKQKGFLLSIRALLDRLETEAGFRLSQAVRSSVLQAVGEATVT